MVNRHGIKYDPDKHHRRSIRLNAYLGRLLDEKLFQGAVVVVTDSLHDFAEGEDTIRFNDSPLAMQPLGLNRVQPRTLGRQATDDQTTTTVLFDLTVVLSQPLANLKTDVPGSIIPNQEQCPLAIGGKVSR